VNAARIIGAAAVVVVALAVAVPLVVQLSHALVIPAVVGVGLYVVVRLVRYFTEV
jgi:hypothetical protein